MSKKNTVKMVEVVALHDLSYLDHNKEPQYRRQSSRPFPLDEKNANDFLARKAVRFVNPVPSVEDVPVADPVVDPVVDASEQADTEANTNSDESADADAAGDDFGDDFAEAPEQAEQSRSGRRGRRR